MSSTPTSSGPERPVLADDSWCFACGRDNPHGLHTAWSLDADGAARARIYTERHHQGWRGVVHGGILCALLDEGMAQCVRLSGAGGVTASLNVRFRKPVPTGTILLIEAFIGSRERRALRLQAYARGENGACYAEAEGVYVRISGG